MNTTVQGHEAIGGATKRGAPDKSVVLPDGVKSAADRANALIEQAKVAKATNDAAGLNDTLKPTVPVARANPGVITGDFDPRNPNPPDFGDPHDTRVQAQSFVPPQAPPAPQPPQPQSEADWEHQFKSLKGRYERDQEEKRRLQQTTIDQQRLLAQLSPPTVPQGEGSGVRFNVAPPPPGRRVTKEEIAEFGPEIIDVMGRRAAEVYEPVIQQLVGELNQVRQQIGGVKNTVVFDARVKMYEDIAKSIPNWDAINNSPQFAQWLDQVDPISHQPRRAFLNAAHNSNTTSQVVDIFNSFLTSHGAANGSGQRPGNGADYSQSNPPTPQVDLMQYAAPGRAKEGQTAVPLPKETIRRSEIKQFFSEKTQGKWAGREAEAADIERRIFSAGNEGRIIDG